jgi:ribosomal-protein-alanine N-acetyltransferase
MHIIAQTARLVIREFLPEEMETYLNHFNDERVTQYIPKRTREERINIFNKALANYGLTKKLGIWGMFDNDSGDFIGSCLLRSFGEEPGIVELGYSMEQKCWGKGIGTEMGTAMIAHAFSDENTLEIVAVTELENIGSQRVLEKSGIKRVDNIVRDGLELAFFRMGRN